MKNFLPLFFIIFFLQATKAQLKIDPGYALLINDTAYESGSNVFFLFGPENIGIKELATGKACSIVSAEWTFLIVGNVFRNIKAADIKANLMMMKPKDKLFIERIKLASGCFIPPKQISFGVL